MTNKIYHSAPFEAAQYEPIKQTKLDHVVVVTVRNDDPFSLRPFRTFVLDSSTGLASDVADFTTLAAALAAHHALVRGPR
jgi:hypothetical protein